MKKSDKNNRTKVLCIILFIIVLGLISYIVYDKYTNREIGIDYIVTDESEIENNNDKQELNYEEIVTEVKNKFDFAFEYFNSIVSYCGESKLSERKNEETGASYNISSQFNTYNDMYNHLKQYMSEDVINSKAAFNTAKENYIEEDGKLYCATFNKGGIYTYGKSYIQIDLMNENKIVVSALKELIDPSNNIEYKKINLTLEKENGNFIITSYEVQD